eukprot:920930-Rhodomonas_salina.1
MDANTTTTKPPPTVISALTDLGSKTSSVNSTCSSSPSRSLSLPTPPDPACGVGGSAPRT